MDAFWNAVKARAAALDGMSGQARFGVVASFDPTAYAARVMMQPENLLSGSDIMGGGGVGDGLAAVARGPGDGAGAGG